MRLYKDRLNDAKQEMMSESVVSKIADIPKRIVVAGLIRRGRDYLFCWKASDPRKNTHVNQWQMIGGGAEAGETLEQALCREVLEEVSLEITNIHFCCEHDVIIPSYKNTGRPMHIFYKEATADYKSGILKLSPELEKAIWLPAQDFHLYPLNPETMRFTRQIGLYPALPAPSPLC